MGDFCESEMCFCNTLLCFLLDSCAGRWYSWRGSGLYSERGEYFLGPMQSGTLFVLFSVSRLSHHCMAERKFNTSRKLGKFYKSSWNSMKSILSVSFLIFLMVFSNCFFFFSFFLETLFCNCWLQNMASHSYYTWKVSIMLLYGPILWIYILTVNNIRLFRSVKIVMLWLKNQIPLCSSFY